jgi:serine/threonine-protein kinase
MAPEQLRGEKVDRRTDVFALGIVLWELFARTHLFKRETDFLTFQGITTDPIPDVTEARPDVPPAIAAVIAKALSRSMDDRYPTARVMGEALAQSVATLGGPLSAAAISDEIGEAFETRLTDQRALIRIAREGGALALDQSLGPAVGHGTELMTTPVSLASGESSPTSKTQADVAGETVVLSSSDLVVDVLPRIPPRARSETMSVAPLKIAPTRPSWVVPVALLALCAIAVTIVFLARSPSGGAVATNAVPNDAPRVGAHVADAAVGAMIPDAAPAVAQPADAAISVPADAAVTISPRPPVTPPKPPLTPTKPNGPPGFITIDASPMYAVIYIDGKQYGETPLGHVELAPGKHVVRAVSPSGTSRTFGITIESGKVAPTRRIEW